MYQLLNALGDLFFWLLFLPPAISLAALVVLSATWLAARRAMRGRQSRALGLLQVWAAMLALSCVLLLAAWAVSRVFDAEIYGWSWRVAPGLVTAAFAPPAHALRTTLLRLIGRPGSGGGPRADALRTVAWLVFAAVLLVCVHPMAMAVVFPFGGGEFHAMFAYTQEGRVDVALFVWRCSVLILGIAGVAFAAWVPLRWWVAALLACAVGLWHWEMVVDWHPQSPRFHRMAVALFIAQPVAVMAIAAAGAAARARLRSHRARGGHGDQPQVAAEPVGG